MKTIASLLLFSILSITAQEVKDTPNIFLQLRRREACQTNRIFSSPLTKIDNPDTELFSAGLNSDYLQVWNYLALGVNVNATTSHGITPLYCAVSCGENKLVTFLLNRGASPDSFSYDNKKRTPLHSAAHYGHPECMALLLEAGANPNISSACGYTPLHDATYLGQAECMALLLEARADPNARNCEGHTALYCAILRGSPHCTSALNGYKPVPQVGMAVLAASKCHLPFAIHLITHPIRYSNAYVWVLNSLCAAVANRMNRKDNTD